MEKAILAAYSGLTVTALMITILGLTVLYTCYKENNYNSSFWLTLAITLTWGSEFVLKGWWTIWKNDYISRKPVSWMLDHSTVLIAATVMTFGGLLFIKTLTEDSPQGRIWQVAVGVVICVIMMTYLKR